MGESRASAAISIVVPSYNHERFLADAVGSVRAQTLPADELVVVDDGSTDGSVALLDRLRFEGMRIEARDNRGAHDALNRAIEASRGEWIAILNSDDVMEPGRIEEAWGIASATGAAMVVGSVTPIGEDGGPAPAGHDITRWLAEVTGLAERGFSLDEALRTHNVAVTTSNFFLHRSLWRALGGFRAWRWVHDYDFLLRATMRFPGRIVWEPSHHAVRYRVHGANTISESHDRALDERARMLGDVRSLRARVGAALDSSARREVVRAVGRTGALAPVRVGSGPAGDAAAPGVGATAVDGAGARLRVGLVARSLGTGGLEEVVALLAQALPASGVEARVYCTERGGPVADRLARSGVAVAVGDGRARSCASWAESAGVDVVSTHFVPLDVTRSLVRAGVPVVDTVHNTYAWLSEAQWAEERERGAAVQGVVAVSRTAGDYWSSRAGREVDAIVPNGVHPGRVARVPRSFARGILGVPPDDPLAVTVGRLTRQKNPDGLLRAFAAVLDSVPHARLLLVGPDDVTVPMSELSARHRALFEGGRVRTLGARTDVGVVLSAADVFVSSSFYEGWSVAASEAAWLGLPMVLTDAGAATTLVGERGERGFVVPNPLGDPLAVDDASIERALEAATRGGPEETAATSERALARALVSVLGEPGSWAARASATAGWARAALSPSAMAGRYATVLRGAADGSWPARATSGASRE